jgi:hypothetical protein
MGDFNESPFWCAFFGVSELASLIQRFGCSIPFVFINCLRTLSYCLRLETKVRQTGDRSVGVVKRTQLSPFCDLTFETARIVHSLARLYTTAVLNQIIKTQITYKTNAL